MFSHLIKKGSSSIKTAFHHCHPDTMEIMYCYVLLNQISWHLVFVYVCVLFVSCAGWDVVWHQKVTIYNIYVCDVVLNL